VQGELQGEHSSPPHGNVARTLLSAALKLGTAKAPEILSFRAGAFFAKARNPFPYRILSARQAAHAVSLWLRNTNAKLGFDPGGWPTLSWVLILTSPKIISGAPFFAHFAKGGIGNVSTTERFRCDVECIASRP